MANISFEEACVRLTNAVNTMPALQVGGEELRDVIKQFIQLFEESEDRGKIFQESPEIIVSASLQDMDLTVFEARKKRGIKVFQPLPSPEYLAHDLGWVKQRPAIHKLLIENGIFGLVLYDDIIIVLPKPYLVKLRDFRGTEHEALQWGMETPIALVSFLEDMARRDMCRDYMDSLEERK